MPIWRCADVAIARVSQPKRLDNQERRSMARVQVEEGCFFSGSATLGRQSTKGCRDLRRRSKGRATSGPRDRRSLSLAATTNVWNEYGAIGFCSTMRCCGRLIHRQNTGTIPSVPFCFIEHPIGCLQKNPEILNVSTMSARHAESRRGVNVLSCECKR